MGVSMPTVVQTGLRVLARKRVLALPAALGALAALWPDGAFALPRPTWNPGPPWAPLDPKSPEMHMISNLFWIMLVLSTIVFIIVVGAIAYIIRNNSAKAGDTEPPPQIYGSRPVEITWTAIPFVILVVAFGFTVKYIHDINTAPPGAHPLDIVAKAHQWWWEFDYPTLNITTANEVHVPANVPLHFHVESADVIHSFWVPQLQRQIDANPGQDNAVFAEMDTPGIYGGDCYEYCGDAHAWMKFRMVVQPKGAFNAWASHMKGPASKPSGGLALAGEKLFMSSTCVECHTIDMPGSKAGGTAAPNLTHLASRWTIGAGAARMTLGDAMGWVHQPSHFKPGVLMPGYPLLSQHQLKSLATYLMSLK
jgi:cytochrome c oxidase subunit 2